MPMQFNDSTGLEGVFCTVRAGLKWGHLEPGDIVTFQQTGATIGVGEVVAVFSGPLALIPDHFLSREHDPTCRTLPGLKFALERTYERELEWEMIMVAVLLYRHEASLH